MQWLDSAEAHEALEAQVDAVFRERYGYSYRGDDMPPPVAALVTTKSDASTNGDSHGQPLSLAQLKQDFPSLFGPDADDDH